MAQQVAQPQREAEIKFTYRDWLQLPEDGQRYEIIEGELFVTPAPAFKHGWVASGLFSMLSDFAVRQKVGRFFFAPIGVKFSTYSVAQPDIFFISRERMEVAKEQIEEQAIRTVPDLIVEITSPRTAKLDRTRKKALYARFGVKEYWIADPRRETIELFTLAGREYQLYRTFGKGDTLRSPLLSKLRIPVSTIFP